MKKNMIYEIYKAFYGKEPDFREENKKNITIEMQAMFYLLQEFGIVLGNYRFVYSELDPFYMPISMELQDVLIAMLNHENKEFASSLKIDETLINKVNIIGSSVQSYLIAQKNFVEALRLVCSIRYSMQSIIPSVTDNEICEFNHCQKEDILKAKKLMRLITLDLTFDKVNGHPGM